VSILTGRCCETTRKTALSEETGYRPTISELPSGERPRERLARLGASALSDAELLAIILRVGVGGENVIRVAERLLARFGGLGGLARATIAEIEREHGIGQAKAVQIKSAFELGSRLLAEVPDARPKVTSPEEAAALLMGDMAHLQREEMRVLLLDTRHQLVHIQRVYVGSINASVIRISELFQEAVIRNCPALVVAHNHPSGDPNPSPEDAQVTSQLVEAGRLLDIEVLDHLIIGRGRFVSLRERGLGFD
jgi:DNA repair protein RadC